MQNAYSRSNVDQEENEAAAESEDEMITPDELQQDETQLVLYCQVKSYQVTFNTG